MQWCFPNPPFHFASSPDFVLFCLSTHSHFPASSFSGLNQFYLINVSSVVSCSWPPERSRPATTVRSWRRSSSTTRRSDASLVTDIYPRTSSTRARNWGLWKRLAVGSTCLLHFLFFPFRIRTHGCWCIYRNGLTSPPCPCRGDCDLGCCQGNSDLCGHTSPMENLTDGTAPPWHGLNRPCILIYSLYGGLIVPVCPAVLWFIAQSAADVCLNCEWFTTHALCIIFREH